MELRQIRYFVAVAETENFHHAAKILNISQPALWRQIRDLELELGVVLFERIGRGVQLTEIGHILLRKANALLADAGSFAGIASRYADGEIGRIRVAYNEVAPRYQIVWQSFQKMRLKYPELELVLTPMTTPEQRIAMAKGQIDAGFGFHEVPNNDLAQLLIGESRIVLALPEAHHLAAKRQLSLTDLTDEGFIFLRREVFPDFWDRLTTACVEAGFRPRVVQEAMDERSQITSVSVGMGICFVSDPPPRHDGVVFRPILDRVRSKLSLIWSKSNNQKILRQFLSQVCELMEDNSQ